MYFRKVKTDNKLFKDRKITVVSNSGTEVINVPDNEVLCDGCNTNLWPNSGYLGYDHGELVGFYCKDCMEKIFSSLPEMENLKDILPRKLGSYLLKISHNGYGLYENPDGVIIIEKFLKLFFLKKLIPLRNKEAFLNIFVGVFPNIDMLIAYVLGHSPIHTKSGLVLVKPLTEIQVLEFLRSGHLEEQKTDTGETEGNSGST